MKVRVDCAKALRDSGEERPEGFGLLTGLLFLGLSRGVVSPDRVHFLRFDEACFPVPEGLRPSGWKPCFLRRPDYGGLHPIPDRSRLGNATQTKRGFGYSAHEADF